MGATVPLAAQRCKIASSIDGIAHFLEAFVAILPFVDEIDILFPHKLHCNAIDFNFHTLLLVIEEFANYFELLDVLRSFDCHQCFDLFFFHAYIMAAF